MSITTINTSQINTGQINTSPITSRISPKISPKVRISESPLQYIKDINDSLQLLEKQKTEQDLLTTNISTYTQHVFAQLLLIISMKKLRNQGDFKELHRTSRDLIYRINELFGAFRVTPFQILEDKESPKNNIKIDVDEKKMNVAVIDRKFKEIKATCNNMISLCSVASKREAQSNQLFRTNWTEDDGLVDLKKNSRSLILKVNSILVGSSFPTITLREPSKRKHISNKIKKMIYHYTLHCNFSNDEETQKSWDKVQGKVESHFKKNILIEITNSEINDKKFKLLDALDGGDGPIKATLKERGYLLRQLAIVGDKLKEDEIRRDLKRNEIDILGAYHTRISTIARALQHPLDKLHLLHKELRSHLNDLRVIFNKTLKDVPIELCSKFLEAISDSIKTHYIEGYLEFHIEQKIEAMLVDKQNEEIKEIAKRKRENPERPEEYPLPIDYESWGEAYWRTLLTSTTFTIGEIKRALLSESIWIVNSKYEIELYPPEKPTEGESEEVKARKIDDWLPPSEEVLSIHFGDPTGKLLERFRVIGYNLLLKKAQEKEEQSLSQSKSQSSDWKKSELEEQSQSSDWKKSDLEEQSQNCELKMKFESDLFALKEKFKKGEDLDETTKSTKNVIKKILKDEQELKTVKKALLLKDICTGVWGYYNIKSHDNDKRTNEVVFKDEINPVIEIFRMKINEYLEKTKKVEEISLLDMDEALFRAFAPVMKKIEDKVPLTAEEKGLLAFVAAELAAEFPKIMEDVGIEKIARRLFIFHKAVNGSFLVGPIITLKRILELIYPEDKKSLKSLHKLQDTSKIYVVLGDNGKITLQWEISEHMFSENWLFTGILRIELPPISSDELGKVSAKFEINCINQSLKEENDILEKIFKMRCVLKAMKFPEGSLVKIEFAESEAKI